MKKRILNISVITFVTFLVTGYGAEQETSSGWRFSAGPVFRTGAELSYKGGSRSSSSLINDQVDEGISGNASDAGSTSALDNHEYDDGYVRPDAGTASDGNTWYWGYENNSQVQGDRLVFTAENGYETEFSRDGDSSGLDAQADDESVGVQLQAEYLFNCKRTHRIGLFTSFSAFRFSMDQHSLTYSEDQSWKVYQRYIRDSYDLNGITPPAAPYAHGPDGPTPADPSPAPVIDASPQRTTYRERVDEALYETWNDVRTVMDLDVYTISLGADVFWQNERVTAGLALGPTVSLVETELSRSETLYSSRDNAPAEELDHWYASDDSSKVAAGAFCQAQAGVVLFNGDLALQLFYRYDWVDDLDDNTSAGSWAADLSGHNAGVLLTLKTN